MKARILWIAALFLISSAAAHAIPTGRGDKVPLEDVTGPWLQMLRADNPTLRTAAGTVLADIVRKHPSAASDVVRKMAGEGDGNVSAEHERRLVTLAKESPATVSALIQLIRQRETDYRARNFGVKVLSQIGPAAATPEFVEALAEKYCPVPGAYFRVLKALGTDATPILAAAYRHANPFVRTRAMWTLRTMARTEPAIQKLFDALQAEPALLQKVREGTPPDRIAAFAALAELARTTPGTGTLLVNSLKDITQKDVLADAQKRLVELGRESPEVVAALVAGVRSRDNYRVRSMAIKVLPKVGSALNSSAIVEALGDHYCPVPYQMQRILLTAGQDAVPVLNVALQHPNREVRDAATQILQAMPR